MSGALGHDDRWAPRRTFDEAAADAASAQAHQRAATQALAVFYVGDYGHCYAARSVEQAQALHDRRPIRNCCGWF